VIFPFDPPADCGQPAQERQGDPLALELGCLMKVCLVSKLGAPSWAFWSALSLSLLAGVGTILPQLERD
jgi:hypothetical protein